MTLIEAYCYEAASPKAPFVRTPFTIDTEQLSPNDVVVKIDYTGLCHSDVMVHDGETFSDVFPFVGGHEGCGLITNVGSSVNPDRIGQRVVIGWFCGSCTDCQYCHEGSSNLCDHAQLTIIGRKGTFASHVVINKNFATPVPEKMLSEEAGIFACAGTTVAGQILKEVSSSKKAAVISCGGLGHLALQYCVKSGLDTTIISRSHTKDDLALELGASQVITYEELKDHQQEFDFIINCSSANIDYPSILNTLKKNGKITSVSFPSFKDGIPMINLPAPLMLLHQLTFSSAPSPAFHEFPSILEFSAHNNIHPLYEVRSISQINETIADLKAGNARFRYVFKLE